MTQARGRPRLDAPRPERAKRTGPSGVSDRRSDIDLSEIPAWIELVAAKVKLELCRKNFYAARKIIRRAEARFLARRLARASGVGSIRCKLDEEAKMELHVGSLGINVRITNGLERYGVAKVRALVAMTRREMLDLPNFGMKSLKKVEDALWKLGLELRRDPVTDSCRLPAPASAPRGRHGRHDRDERRGGGESGVAARGPRFEAHHLEVPPKLR